MAKKSKGNCVKILYFAFFLIFFFFRPHFRVISNVSMKLAMTDLSIVPFATKVSKIEPIEKPYYDSHGRKTISVSLLYQKFPNSLFFCEAQENAHW